MMNTTNEPQQRGPPWHPGPQCGCWSCQQVRKARRKAERANRPSYVSSVWLGIGIVWAIVSGIVWAYTDSAANTCKNALVGALDQSRCTTVTFWHDMAGISMLLAVVTIIFAGVAMHGTRTVKLTAGYRPPLEAGGERFKLSTFLGGGQMNIKLIAIPAIALAAGISLAACGGTATLAHNTAPATHAATVTHPSDGCWTIAKPYIEQLASDLSRSTDPSNYLSGGIYYNDIEAFDLNNKDSFTCESGTTATSPRRSSPVTGTSP